MDTMNFFVNVISSLPYVVLVLILVPTLGFVLMNRVMTRGINLREALFEHDNPVAGFEFGGQLLLLLYAGFCAVMGPTVGSFATDLMVATGWVAGSMVVIAVVRYILGTFVKSHNGSNEDLNHEIFVQRNWAAACYSLALSIGVVSGLTEENMFGATPLRDLVIAATVLVLGLSIGWLFRFTHLRGGNAFHALFTSDNPAAGVSLLGFAIASNVIFVKVAHIVRITENSLITTAGCVLLYSVILLGLNALCRIALEYGLRLMLKIDISDETFIQKNTGAGFIDAAVTVGAALLITGTIA